MGSVSEVSGQLIVARFFGDAEPTLLHFGSCDGLIQRSNPLSGRSCGRPLVSQSYRLAKSWVATFLFSKELRPSAATSCRSPRAGLSFIAAS